jgi:UDP-glucuronate 4-epimerase
LDRNEIVIAIDNINDYYDVRLKYARLKELGIEQKDIGYNKVVCSSNYPNFHFIKIDIEDKISLCEIFRNNVFDIVCNFAAQVGVIYSTINPKAYIQSNITGFLNIIDCCKEFEVNHFIYASSSSVYGNNTKLPFAEDNSISCPKNLYAKTKIVNEYLAEMYCSHFNISTIGLRFFTVYGTWGRPDMAMMVFADAISSKLPINIFGNGQMKRDFTYIGDVVNCIEKIIYHSITKQCSNRIYNIGSSNPIGLMDLITKLEYYLGYKATMNFLPMRSEEIKITYADSSKLIATIGFKPNTSIDNGINEFVKWYNSENPLKK